MAAPIPLHNTNKQRFANLLLVLFFATTSSLVSCLQAPSQGRSSSRSIARRTARTRPSSSAWGVTDAVADAQITGLAVADSGLDKEPVRTGRGPAVLDRPQVERKEKVDEPVKERRRMGSEAWEVRIYNDGMNTREHVARSLVQVTGMSELVAYQTMMQAHQNGIAVVGRWVYEVAEMYHDALQKNGIICDLVPVDEDL